MVQIVACNEEILKQVPHVFQLLYELYGEKTIGLFAIMVDGQLGFIGRYGAECVYIHKDGYTCFTLNQNEEIGALKKDGLEVYFGDSVYFVDSNKIEHYIDLVPSAEMDDQGYDGYVTYKQYNPNNDTLCEIRYQHMYREMDGKPIIYGYHTKKMDCVYIDEEFSTKSRPSIGFLPKRAKYYSKVEFDDDMVGSKWVAIKEYGLMNFLLNGTYQLQIEKTAIRYVKTKYLGLDGNSHDFWPFGEQIKEEDMAAFVQSYGFQTEVPLQMIEIYNGRDSSVNELQQIASQMKMAIQEAKESPSTDKCALLTLKKD